MVTRRPIEIEDLYRLFSLTDVTVDPAGRRVAFTAARPVAEADDYESRIWVYDRETGTTRPWTREDVRSSSPRWSPDGRHLAFLRRSQGGPAQLCVMSADGGESRELTNYQHGVSEYEWSPDSVRFVLTAATVEEWSPDGRGAKTEPVRVIETLRYKFNGRGFIFDKNRHVYVLDLEGGQPLLVSGSDWDDTNPAWSHDGARIAFASARHAEREFDLAADIFVVTLASGETTQITETLGAAESPCFSPDDQVVAYIGADRRTSMPSHRKVWVTQSTGGRQRPLGADFDRTVAGVDRLTWSPHGDRVYALYEDEGRIALLAVDTVTGERVQGDRTLPRQIHSYACLAGEGSAVIAASSSQRPPELYLHDLEGRSDDVCLTEFHNAWMDTVQLTDMEAYWGESADGTSVPCWIMRPPGLDPEGKVPGVLKIHGGPYAQFGYNFNHELQLYCARGYALFFCNPRGSSGYDEEWARSLGRHRGILDYQDVMACADGAIAQFPFVDETRLAVTGGSYGGYMTSWIVGHTKRFAVACSEAAPNNLYSMSGSSDLAGSNHRLVYGFTAQENPEFYMERSPISYAQAIDTPLLIIHSENDLRVSIEQGEQLFVALRLQRKPVRFLRFPGENHNLPRTGRPTHRVQRLSHILTWFADFLST